MTIIMYVLLTVEVLIGLLLIGVVLLQRSKDQGLGLAFGSGMGESLFGARTSNVMLKITIVLAVVFFVNTMLLARLFSAKPGSNLVVNLPEAPSAAPVAAGTQSTTLPPMDIPTSPESPTPVETVPAMPPVEIPAVPDGGATPVAELPVVPPVDVPVPNATVPAGEVPTAE